MSHFPLACMLACWYALRRAGAATGFIGADADCAWVVGCWQHCTWQLPIFVQNGPLMYVQVQTTTVQPLIVGLLNGKKLVASVAKDGSETLPVVDFGKLPVGQERVLDIKLSNCPERPELARETDVTPLPLDPFGAFVLLKFPCRLVPSQSQTISLSFQVSLLPAPVHSPSARESVIGPVVVPTRCTAGRSEVFGMCVCVCVCVCVRARVCV